MGDVAFLIDTTGSMGGAIGAVKAAFDILLEKVNVDVPTDRRCRWAVSEYKDYEDGGSFSAANGGIRVNRTLTSDLALVSAALGTLTPDGGGDLPEQQMKSLQTLCNNWVSRLGGSSARTTSPSGNSVFERRRTIIWCGDVYGHEGGTYPTLAQLGRCYRDLDTCIQIIAIDAGGLDGTGQASTLARWTHGRVFSLSTDPDELAGKICAALKAERWEC